MKRLLIALFMLAAASPAFAADCWTNAAGTQTNCAEVPAFLNGSNQTVPVSATNPLPVTSVGGGGGAVTISAGGGMDAPGFNAIVPGNEFIVGGVYNNAPPTLTNGRGSPFLLDVNGNLLIASPSLLAAISAPLTPCTAADCSSAFPVGSVLIYGTPTFNLGTLNGAATAANQPTNNAQGAAIAGQTGNTMFAEALAAPPTYTTAQTYPGVMDLAGNFMTARGVVILNPNGGMSVTTASHATGTLVGTKTGQTQPVQFLKTSAYGTIKTITVTSKAVVTQSLKLYVYYSFPSSTTFTDAAAISVNAADDNKVVKPVILSGPDSGQGTQTTWWADNVNIPVNVTAFYIAVVNLGTAFTPASTSDFNMTVTVEE